MKKDYIAVAHISILTESEKERALQIAKECEDFQTFKARYDYSEEPWTEEVSEDTEEVTEMDAVRIEKMLWVIWSWTRNRLEEVE